VSHPRRASVVLFTRDLRLSDNPALAAAAAAGPVLALFVLDDSLLSAPTTGPNRIGFLLESLTDLRASLRARGGELFVRRGNPAAVAVAAARSIDAGTIHLAADVSALAARRSSELRGRAEAAGIEVRFHAGVAIVGPSTLHPSGGGDHYRVFTPYWRAWNAAPRRALAVAPESLITPEGLEPGTLPSLTELASGFDPVGRHAHLPLHLLPGSPHRARGGETEAWRRLKAWPAVRDYTEASNALGDDATARISSYLHFGCLSAASLEAWALDQRGTPIEDEALPGSAAASVDAFVRQLCGRDVYLAVTAAFPAIGRADYRPRPIVWRRDDGELAAWREGRTGVSLVDAAMHQLLAEGFVHNRARLVASSYLVKTLRHHWSEGAAHYLYWLTDGDVASNSGNWQWMAGTGNDTRPNRMLNPERQAERFDRDGRYRAGFLPGWGGQARLNLD
jgi:deoxyribodipyrimidine photo-lyase